jgi:threonine dehydratase
MSSVGAWRYGIAIVPSVRLDLDRIRAAVPGIEPAFLDSPQYECAPLGEALNCSITLKVETLNPVRSFKGRGTETVMSSLEQRGGARMTVCASAGNLGQALAFSGARRGLPVTVVAAENANAGKIARIRSLGATVRLEGDDIEDARILARRIAEQEGAYLVEDSLDLATCEGAATMGLELLEGAQLDVLLIALGGGAMASGVGYVAKSLAPQVEVIGIQPAGAPAMALSWRKGSVVETDILDTIADGVAGRCPIPEVLEDLLVVLDDVLLVSEESIKAGMRLLYRHAGLIVEPSAALGIAAILEDGERFAGRRVGTIICGSNIMPSDFERWALN